MKSQSVARGFARLISHLGGAPIQEEPARELTPEEVSAMYAGKPIPITTPSLASYCERAAGEYRRPIEGEVA